MALLADYLRRGSSAGSLSEYLGSTVFTGTAGETIVPTSADVEGFEAFIRRYEQGLPVERAAITALRRA